MFKLAKVLIPAIVAVTMLVSCSETGPNVTEDRVVVEAGQLDVHFKRGGRTFSNTYMIFGGMEMNHSNAFCKITLAGLDIRTARTIAAQYPDFYMCKSPGARLAQRAVQDFEIVPADSKVLKALKKSISMHKKSIEQGGDQVCVKLEGEVLRLTSVIARELNEDITSQLPPQVHRDYYLVTSAKVINGKEALAGKM